MRRTRPTRFYANDTSRSTQGFRNASRLLIPSGMLYRTDWDVIKFEDERAYNANRPYARKHIAHNLLLNGGGALLLDLMAGISSSHYDNANSSIGVGDGGPTVLTGTTTFTNGSATVSGSGTSFSSNVTAGDYLIGPDFLLYQVQTVGSNTSITLTGNFTGTTASGQTTSVLLREIATQTALRAGTNKLYKAMDATYPSRSGQIMTYRATFGANDANWFWREFAINNGSSGGGTNLNRKIQHAGMKASPSVWVVEATFTVA